MKVCIFGAGAVGGHMAVRLTKAGADVSAVMRGANLEAVRAAGLQLRAADQDTIQARPKVSDNPADLGEQDVVVLSVKYRALAQALRSISPLVGPNTQILSAMNGMPWWFAQGLPIAENAALNDLLDPDRAFSQTIPVERWTACVVTSGNVVTEPGVVTNTTPGRNKLRLGNSAGTIEPVIEELAALTVAGGYDASVVTDIRQQIWCKLLINAGISSVATICEQTVAEICNDPNTRAVSMGAIGEILALGKALGFDVEADPAAMTDPQMAPPHLTSFLQDLKNGRPLEIENGILSVVELARLASVPAVRLETVAAVMAARSSGSVLNRT